MRLVIRPYTLQPPARPADHLGQMRALLLIACFLFIAFMAMFQTGGMTHAYAAMAAAGSLLLSLK
jgi:hypothetical protein